MADVTDVTDALLVPGAAPPSPATMTDEEANARGSTWAWAGVGVLAAVGLVALGAHGLGDDSYISLDYARTLLEHGRWGLVNERTANTATSPLNVWLLAAGLGLTGSATGAVGLVLAAAFGAVGAWTRQLGLAVGLGPALPLAALGLLATSPLLVSTLGLETYLGVAVVVGVASAAVRRRGTEVGLLCGLAVLVRPDYAVPATLVALLLFRPGGGAARIRGLVRVGLLAGAVALPWHVFAWIALGGFVPDTFAFKTNPAAGRMPAMIADFDHFYWSRTPVAVAVVGVVVVAGWCCAIGHGVHAARTRGGPVDHADRADRAGRVAATFAVSGTAHAAALMTINAYPQAWYYGPLVAGGALAAAVTLAAHPGRTAGALVTAYGAIALVVAGQGGVPWTAADMNSNFADAAAYQRIGHELPALVGTAPVAPPGEIGALAWACRCDLVDQFSSRANARGLLEHRFDRGGHLSRAVLAVNGRFRPQAAPTPVAYRLRYVLDPAAPSADALRTWWVTSPQSGAPFRIVLVPERP